MKSNHLKPIGVKLLKYISSVAIVLGFTQANVSFSPAPEIFIAGSPCDPAMRPFLSIPPNMDCEFVRWKLFLYKYPGNHNLNRFKLNYTYGMPKQGTRGLVNDGTIAEIEGKWDNAKNNGNLPGYSLLNLYPDARKTRISFVKLDQNLLHLLDEEGKLMIGNAAWSYTLNRIKGSK